VPIPVLVLPPRPPELPTAPPPVKPGEPPSPLRNDALLSNWIEDIERVLKDAWLKLQQAFAALEARVLVLEQRIADTYTFGQRGALTLIPDDPNWVALPLRVVRDEEVLEVTAAAENPDTSATVDIQRNGASLYTLTIDGPFVSYLFPTPIKVVKNDKLAVVLLDDGGGGCANVVVQIRCR